MPYCHALRNKEGTEKKKKSLQKSVLEKPSEVCWLRVQKKRFSVFPFLLASSEHSSAISHLVQALKRDNCNEAH
jgi:predicted ferric reductase